MSYVSPDKKKYISEKYVTNKGLVFFCVLYCMYHLQFLTACSSKRFKSEVRNALLWDLLARIKEYRWEQRLLQEPSVSISPRTGMPGSLAMIFCKSKASLTPAWDFICGWDSFIHLMVCNLLKTFAFKYLNAEDYSPNGKQLMQYVNTSTTMFKFTLYSKIYRYNDPGNSSAVFALVLIT